MYPSLMTELAHALMEDRRREAEQYRLGRRSRPRRDRAHARFSRPRFQSGPRDTRPPGRRRQRRASDHRTQRPTG